MHGGPWSRDRPQFDPWAQFLAAAGLCCIQVNYRGSRGFGKRFRDAGDRQWALAMQDDLVDALQSAEVADLIDTGRIAAIGHGYGGYAALMLATQAEVPLACVVAGSAPTDLPSYVASLLSLGGAAGAEHAARIGDPADGPRAAASRRRRSAGPPTSACRCCSFTAARTRGSRCSMPRRSPPRWSAPGGATT